MGSAPISTSKPPSARRTAFIAEARRSLAIALQPIVEFQTGNVLAYEALARGTGQRSGQPVGAIFEEARLFDAVVDIDLLLAEKAMSAFADRRRQHWSMLFVNLHGSTLVHWKRVCDRLSELIAGFGLRAGEICIELSEANHVLTMADLATVVGVFRDMGLRIAVDDFGAGYSGLSMLYHAEPDFLKIDRFFIHDIPQDARKRLFVGSIVDLAHGLGIRVIAEGIETAAELTSCRSIRCDLAQGYHIARPETDFARLPTRYELKTRGRPPRRSAAIALANCLERPAPVRLDATLHDVLDVIVRSRGQEIVPVVDDAGLPHGVLRAADLRPILFSPFGRELARNAGLPFRLGDYLHRTLSVDVDTEILPLLDLIGGAALNGVLVTENMRYIGHIPPAGLIRLANASRLEVAAGLNPLTRLPGTDAIAQTLGVRLAQAGRDRLFALIDIDNFRPFNAAYGFEAGDRAILLCAEELRATLQSGSVFVGHVRGDDFFLAAESDAAATLPWQLDAFADRFADAARTLLTTHDLAAGGFLAPGPEGASVRYPLLGCTIATLRIPGGVGVNAPDRVWAALCGVKADAKRRQVRMLHRDWSSGGAEGGVLPAIDRGAV